MGTCSGEDYYSESEFSSTELSTEIDSKLLSLLEKQVENARSVERSRNIDSFSPFPHFTNRPSRVIVRLGPHKKNEKMDKTSNWKIEKYFKVFDDVRENGVPTHSTTLSTQITAEEKIVP